MPHATQSWPPPRRARQRIDSFVVTVTSEALQRRVATIADARFRLLEAHEDRAVLARRVNWATWGDRFELAWHRAGEGTAVAVTATKRFATALGDYGQGDRDLRRLIRLLADETTA